MKQLSQAMAILLVIGTLALLTLAADRCGRVAALEDLSKKGTATFSLVTATLVGEIEKQKAVVAGLSRDADVVALLTHPDPSAAPPDPCAARRMGAKLKTIATEAKASVLYLINDQGITIAASNFNEKKSFVGENYKFRSYFKDALNADAGTGFQYALGTTKGEPGLFFSHRVDSIDGKPALGVAVVKMEREPVEESWRNIDYIVYATEKHGTVTATNRDEWRFHTTKSLTDDEEKTVRVELGLERENLKELERKRLEELERERLKELGLERLKELGLEGKRLPELPVNALDYGLVAVTEGGSTARYVKVEGPLRVVPGWQMTVLLPADAVIATVRLTWAMAAFLSGLGFAATAAGALRWWRTTRRRQAAMAEINTELERRVQERTTELSRANATLIDAIRAQKESETKVRRLRDDLAQANRLSILGQVSAGVAHEINQPVAAIRAYTDNADRFLSTGRTETARENMAAISRMADRIGEITGRHKSFARRATGPTEAVQLADAIDGALALLAGRIGDSGVTIERVPSARSPSVVASRIQLEQILVNLVQNALDAVRGGDAPRIAIEVEDKGDAVTVAVRDNGPGVPADVAENLFMPFVTTKEKGLGLGLVISREIAREFGGDLRLESRPGEGATFVLELRRPA